MCFLEHVCYATCKHWGRDRISTACPCARIVNGHVYPCTYTDLVGVVTRPGSCPNCIRFRGKRHPWSVGEDLLDKTSADANDDLSIKGGKRETQKPSGVRCELQILKDFDEPELEHNSAGGVEHEKSEKSEESSGSVKEEPLDEQDHASPDKYVVPAISDYLKFSQPSLRTPFTLNAPTRNLTSFMDRVQGTLRRRESDDSADATGKLTEAQKSV